MDSEASPGRSGATSYTAYIAKKAWFCGRNDHGGARWQCIVKHDAVRRDRMRHSLDFVHDQLSGGEKFRMLTVVDIFSREALAIEVRQRLRGEHVTDVLNQLVRQRGAPKYLFADNGGEFTGRVVDLWAYHHNVRIDFSRPGKPTDNAYIETFNGSLREECLNIHWFRSIAEARRLIQAWRRDNNDSRPHSAFGNLSPSGYLAGTGILPAPIGAGKAGS